MDMTTNDLIKLFWSRDERALEETQKRYADYCFNLANNILNNPQDAEECVNDAYLRIWRSIPPAKPANFVAYLAKTVHNLSVDKLKARMRGKRNAPIVAFEELEDCLFSEDDIISENIAISQLQLLAWAVIPFISSWCECVILKKITAISFLLFIVIKSFASK